MVRHYADNTIATAEPIINVIDFRASGDGHDERFAPRDNRFQILTNGLQDLRFYGEQQNFGLPGNDRIVIADQRAIKFLAEECALLRPGFGNKQIRCVHTAAQQTTGNSPCHVAATDKPYLIVDHVLSQKTDLSGVFSLILALSFDPFTKQCSADTNDGCSFVDRRSVVCRHAHR